MISHAALTQATGLLAKAEYVPNMDEVGLPASPALFVFLMLLTLLLHVIFMNFALGGSIVAVGCNVAGLLGRKNANKVATAIYQAMPPVISMTITMGVAPLLFVQVLYGQYFYSANVLVGMAWFSWVLTLMAGFYLTYWLTYRGSSRLRQKIGKWDNRPGIRLVVSLVAMACFFWVAWMFTNNHELSNQPGLWSKDGSWAGPRFHVMSDTTIWRFLHDLVGMTAIAGLWIAALGWWRLKRIQEDEQLHRGMISLGLKTAAVLTIAQIAVGVVFLFMLGESIWKPLLTFQSIFGGIWTVTLAVVLVFLVVLVMAAMKPQSFGLFLMSTVLAVVVLAGMLIGREGVRLLLIGRPEAGNFSLSDWSGMIYAQPVSMIIFFILLVLGLATVALMIWWMVQGRSEDYSADTGTTLSADSDHGMSEPSSSGG
jgi:hypothetical protein